MKNTCTVILNHLTDGGNKIFNHEYGILLITLVSFLVFPRLSRTIDITAAPVDPGILSIVIIAVLAFLIFKSVTWWAIRAIWPVFAEYSELQFEQNFTSLLSWQKVLIYLGFYLLLLFGFVVTLAALM
ncbi:hypothetical protein [Arcticibacter tournemirensis]